MVQYFLLYPFNLTLTKRRNITTEENDSKYILQSITDDWPKVDMNAWKAGYSKMVKASVATLIKILF